MRGGTHGDNNGCEKNFDSLYICGDELMLFGPYEAGSDHWLVPDMTFFTKNQKFNLKNKISNQKIKVLNQKSKYQTKKTKYQTTKQSIKPKYQTRKVCSDPA